MLHLRLAAQKEWRVYLIVCKGGAYYTGIAKDVEARVAAHNVGRGAKFTRSRRPVRLVANSRWMMKSNALKLEAKVKKIRGHMEKLRALVPTFF